MTDAKSKDEPAADSKASDADKMIEQWFADHFHGSAVARDLASYEVAFEAKEKLKKLIQKLQKGA